MTDKNSSKLEPIQVLRGLAAAMVVVLHSYDEIFRVKPGYPFSFGVDIFFVISGFVMVYASRDMFGQAGAWKTFMERRVIRIVPLYWFYTTLLVVVALIMPHALDTARLEPGHLALSYLFIPHMRPVGDVQPFLALGWTLNYEMYFYVVFASLLFLPMEKMLAALTAFFVGAVVAGFFVPEGWHALWFWTRPAVLEFVGGAWVAWLFLKGVRVPVWTLVLSPVLAVGLAFLHDCPAEIRLWISEIFAVLAVALLILPRGMENAAPPRPAMGLGDASYTVYLSHPFILTALGLIAKKAGFHAPWALFGGCVAACLGGGYILYLIVEKPLLSAMKRLFLRHEKAV